MGADQSLEVSITNGKVPLLVAALPSTLHGPVPAGAPYASCTKGPSSCIAHTSSGTGKEAILDMQDTGGTLLTC